jgi:hypothetical protein
MSNPTSSQLHPVNVLLTNFGIRYRQNRANFVFDKVFPVLKVGKRSDRYNIWTKGFWFKDKAKPRAGDAPSAGSGYETSTDTYNCDVIAFHKDVNYQDRATADAIFDLDQEAAEYVTDILLQGQEAKWVSDYFTTSVWGTDSTPTNLWSDLTASSPGEDVDTGKRTVLLNTGQEPNTFVLGYDVAMKLKRHPDVLAKFGLPLGSSRNVSNAMLAEYFDVERLFVAKSIINSGRDKEADSFAFNHGKHALLCYVAPTVGAQTLTAGLTFAWEGLEGAGYGQEIGISKIDLRPSGIKVDRIEGECAWDNKVTASDCGYFFASVVA